MPPPNPMTAEDTEPEMPIRQLSLPPPMNDGAIALGGGVCVPGAGPLYVLTVLVVGLFEFELLVMLLPCWLVDRLSTVAEFCASTVET